MDLLVKWDPMMAIFVVMHFCLTETAVQESNDRFHYCKYNNKSALHNIYIYTLLHIIHSLF